MGERDLRSIKLPGVVAALTLSLLSVGLTAGMAHAVEPSRDQDARYGQASAPTATSCPTNADAGTARQLALGISMLDYDDLGTLDAFTASVGGRCPALWSLWSDWGGANAGFPSGELPSALKARGIVPLIFWQPVDPSNLQSEAFTYERIVAGDFDAYIREWALDAKAWGGPVVLRFAHEMDGSWFPWGTTEKNFDGNTHELFIKAWKRIWRTFRGKNGVGATNVRFLWSPLTPKEFVYPGHRFVDYVGFTAFNWGEGKPWTRMVDLYAFKVTKARRFTSRPIIVAETGTTPLGGDKVAWIKRGHRQVYRKLPQITAVVYFNIDMWFADQPDWSMETTPGALDVYRDLLGIVKFQGQIR